MAKPNHKADAEHGQEPRRGVANRQEARAVEQRSVLRPPLIYEVVRRLGDEEMQRPATSLWWSGIAAGLSISFSLVAEGILQAHLPQMPWRVLVTSFGYCVGFIIVIMARQQLFTEITITAVLPVMAEFTLANLLRMGRLWGIVLIANLVGTAAAALFCTFTPVLPHDLLAAMIAVSRDAVHGAPALMFFRAITAGFLMAALVWLLPSAEGTRLHVIALMTYLIAVGGFAHIVAGSVEAFLLFVNGELGLWPMLSDFIVPVLLGNIVGGTALFALLSYAQVMKEI